MTRALLALTLGSIPAAMPLTAMAGHDRCYDDDRCYRAPVYRFDYGNSFYRNYNGGYPRHGYSYYSPDRCDRGSYYSFDWGDVHFVALDANLLNLNTPIDELVWLENDLATTRALWKVAFFHQTPYATLHHADDPIHREQSGRIPRHEGGRADGAGQRLSDRSPGRADASRDSQSVSR